MAVPAGSFGFFVFFFWRQLEQLALTWGRTQAGAAIALTEWGYCWFFWLSVNSGWEQVAQLLLQNLHLLLSDALLAGQLSSYTCLLPAQSLGAAAACSIQSCAGKPEVPILKFLNLSKLDGFAP